MALTVRKALIAEVGVQVDPDLIDKALLDLQLDGSLEYVYDETLRTGVFRAASQVLTTAKALKSYSEGDLTITYDLQAINERLGYFADKLDDPTVSPIVRPTIKNKSYLW